MKQLILLLAIVAVGCKHKETLKPPRGNDNSNINNLRFPDSAKWLTDKKEFHTLFRSQKGENILVIPADTSYIEFYGKRFYPETTNNYNFSDIDWGPAEITFGDTSKTKP